jgi:hypothetical protein
MSSLMRTGLKLVGAGILAGCGMSLFRWGPCGPSSIWGLLFLLAALGCLAVGALFVVISLLRMLVDRMRTSTAA